jgi:hypothetical protein
MQKIEISIGVAKEKEKRSESCSRREDVESYKVTAEKNSGKAQYRR